MVNAYGEYFKARRLALGLTLRKFCVKHGVNPGNLSRMERGVTTPPSQEKLPEYARMLELKPGTREWDDFIDLAAAARGEFPKPMMSDEELVKKLPLFFRAFREGEDKEALLKKLIQTVRENH